MNSRIALIALSVVLVASTIPVQRLVAAETPTPAKAPTLEGTWRWNFVMPDGTTNRPKLRFNVEDGQLSGKTSFRTGTETPVTNILVNGDQLSFQVIRNRSDRDVVTTYSGKWNDQSIKGRIESDWAGEKQTFAWEAIRAHHGVDGTWRWTNSFFGGGGRGPGPGGPGGRGPGGPGGRGRGFDSRVELEQEGEKITGKTIGRGGPSITITNGIFTNGVIYFEIERTFLEVKSVTKHLGKQSGDTIKGTLESEFNGEDRVIDWEATRVD
jgi:hypothetical protein